MFFLKNHKYLQKQWRLQKNFKTNFLKKIFSLKNNLYLKLSLYKKLFLNITKITILTKYNIKIDCFKYRLLKINKNKLSIIIEEVVGKFIFNINVKSHNIIL